MVADHDPDRSPCGIFQPTGFRRRHPRFVRFGLAAVLAVVAAAALIGGWHGMTGTAHVPYHWPEGTAFHDSYGPAVFLFVGIGVTSLAATLMVTARLPFGRGLAVLAGLMLIGWTITQIALEGYVSALQPAVALVGFTIAFMGTSLPSCLDRERDAKRGRPHGWTVSDQNLEPRRR